MTAGAAPSTVPALPPGYTWRRPTLSDVAAVRDVVAAYDAVHSPETAVTLEDVRAELDNREADLGTRAWLVLDPAGGPVGFGIVFRDDNAGELFCDAYHRPREDAGVGDAVARWLVPTLVERAREVAREAGRAFTVSAGTYADDPVLPALLEGEGLRVARRFLTMLLDLDPADPPPPPPHLPGITVRLVDPSDVSDLQAFHRVLDTAFVDHFDHHQRTWDLWWQDQQESAGLDLSQWWLALDGDQPVGALLATDRVAAEGRGNVRGLGVLRGARGRGVARALLLTCFAECLRRGRTSVELGVDSDSLTGATRLYESVGMRVIRQVDLYRGAAVPG
jgi:GNAT superfamily N-acetyltransferase